MLAFIIIALAVMVGIMMAGVVSILIIYNKHVMKWLTKKVMVMSKEIAEEIFETMED